MQGRVSNNQNDSAPAEFGLHVESLTPERAQRVGVEGQKGVIVSEVEPASFADDIGFGPGDVISQVNEQAVTTAEGYRKAVGRLEEGGGERGGQSAPAQRRPCDDHVPAGSCAGGYQTIRQALSSATNKLLHSRRRLGIFVALAAGGMVLPAARAATTQNGAAHKSAH